MKALALICGGLAAYALLGGDRAVAATRQPQATPAGAQQTAMSKAVSAFAAATKAPPVFQSQQTQAPPSSALTTVSQILTAGSLAAKLGFIPDKATVSSLLGDVPSAATTSADPASWGLDLGTPAPSVPTVEAAVSMPTPPTIEAPTAYTPVDTTTAADPASWGLDLGTPAPSVPTVEAAVEAADSATSVAFDIGLPEIAIAAAIDSTLFHGAVGQSIANAVSSVGNFLNDIFGGGVDMSQQQYVSVYGQDAWEFLVTNNSYDSSWAGGA